MQPDGSSRRIALRPPHPRRLPAIAAAACVLLLAGGVAVPFLLQQREAAALQQRIAALQPQVERAQALRRHVAARPVDAAALLAEWQRVGDAMQVLATLTDLLPDDTYLTTLALRQRKLTISGQSGAAAGLIATLSSGKLIRNPAFAAPVVRDPSGQADTFSLTAEIAP
jgi:general secretion pathway protein L